MKESNAINSSLFTLANCVDAINSKASRIPYRESKLTRILSLGQNGGRTVMILNLAPTRAYHLDTVSSLSFGSRTKRIEVSEIENDPIYRTKAKPLAATGSIAGSNISRQPLRPLTAAHNANKQETHPTKQGVKPVKAFSVYSDTRRVAAQVVRKAEPQKRPADSSATTSRPLKRPADHTSRMRVEPALTRETIDALISQRIDEKLAEKALQDAGSAPALSAELQKRLDDLEHRIDAKEDDEKGQGLQYLLMAKQHGIRGEDASALRMYQLAVPFFPGNQKLKAKMDALEERIRSKKVMGMGVKVEAHNAMSMAQEATQSKATKLYKGHEEEDGEEDFVPPQESDCEESFASDTSFKYSRTARKPKKMAKKLPVFRDMPGHVSGPPSPKTAELLRIINSRDVRQIKTLVGVGAKKADTIVSSLLEMGDEEIQDLDGLMGLRGLSVKSVETMRMGLWAEF